jgi:hypothetical protein
LLDIVTGYDGIEISQQVRVHVSGVIASLCHLVRGAFEFGGELFIGTYGYPTGKVDAFPLLKW